MLEFLNAIDTNIFLFLNSIHSPFWDNIMWWISAKSSWYPFYLFLIGFIILRYKRKSIIIIPAIIILIVLADQISVQCFKNVFQRLRPCREEVLKELIHLVRNKCGGKYGFVSSHAANTFAAASFLSLLFKNKKFTWFILIWAAVVSYSRIYLGVHYPGDILGGTLLGISIGFGVYKLQQYTINKLPYFKQKE